MKVLPTNIANNNKYIHFKSQIHRTNTIDIGINTAIKLGDKGFFNALKHLANDGLKRDIVIGGSNSTGSKLVSALTILKAGNVEYSLKTSQKREHGVDGFHLMGKNVIELIKKLAIDTGNISKKELSEKATEKELIKEFNETYKPIFTG